MTDTTNQRPLAYATHDTSLSRTRAVMLFQKFDNVQYGKPMHAGQRQVVFERAGAGETLVLPPTVEQLTVPPITPVSFRPTAGSRRSEDGLTSLDAPAAVRPRSAPLKSFVNIQPPSEGQYYLSIF
jgi:hypothetical protein